jgi:hypothetical protein
MYSVCELVGLPSTKSPRPSLTPSPSVTSKLDSGLVANYETHARTVVLVS